MEAEPDHRETDGPNRSTIDRPPHGALVRALAICVAACLSAMLVAGCGSSAHRDTVGDAAKDVAERTGVSDEAAAARKQLQGDIDDEKNVLSGATSTTAARGQTVPDARSDPDARLARFCERARVYEPELAEESGTTNARFAEIYALLRVDASSDIVEALETAIDGLAVDSTPTRRAAAERAWREVNEYIATTCR